MLGLWYYWSQTFHTLMHASHLFKHQILMRLLICCFQFNEWNLFGGKMFLIDWTTVGNVLCSLPVGWRYTWWYDWVLLRRTACLPPTASPPMFWVLSGNMHTYISIYWYYSSWNIKRFLGGGINDRYVWECAPPAPGMSDEEAGHKLWPSSWFA